MLLTLILMIKGSTNIFVDMHLCDFCFKNRFQALFRTFTEERKSQLFKEFRDQILKQLTSTLPKEDLVQVIGLIWELIMPTANATSQ